MCKVRGVGIDLCEVSRMEALLADDRFLTRYFTEGEAAYIRGRGQSAAQSMAGLWAAKEAALKALGTGLSLPLKEIEITHTEAGQPQIRLTGRASEAAQGGSMMVSITHEGGMAAAFCVWQGNNMRTLYVSDLDGTLLRSDQRTSAYTNEVINRLTDQGMRFSYATARSYETAHRGTAGLSAKIPLIVYNGAFTIDNVTGERLASNFFGSIAAEILTDLLRHEVYPIVYSFINGAEKFSYLPEHTTPGMRKFLDSRRGDRRDHPVADASALGTGDVFYFTCIDSASKLDPLYAKYLAVCRCVRHTDPYTSEPWLELMPQNASKSNAIGQLKRLLGCDRVVAFGDGVNDIDMFHIADECYAVANAADELKAMATAVIGSNDEDAVAHWLEERNENRDAVPAPCQRALRSLNSL